MENQDEFRKITNEFGATTGRPRDVGYFDAVATKNGVELQAATEVALTKLDCLTGLPDLKICVAYEGAPPRTRSGRRPPPLTPVYEKMESWSEDISGCRTFAELPRAAQDYALRIEALLGVLVPGMVSVGPP